MLADGKTQQGCGAALALAVASLLAWLAAVSFAQPRMVMDERYHYPLVERLASGHWTLVADEVPMLLGSHMVSAAAERVFGIRLLTARATNTLLAVISAFVFAAVARRWRPTHAGDALLHFIWLPILFPVLCMAYTESATMLCLLLALLFHLRRNWAASAGMLLVSCIMRQSNVAWVLFFAVWAIVQLARERAGFPTRGAFPIDSLDVMPPGASRLDRDASEAAMRVGESWPPMVEMLRRVWGHVLVLAAAAIFFLVRGEVGVGNSAGKHPYNVGEFNVAQFYDLAFFTLGLWAPIWLERIAGDVRAVLAWAQRRPAAAAGAVILWIIVLAGLFVTYRNTNRWNHGQSEFIRNWPLEAMDRYPAARLMGALVAMGAVVLVVLFVASRRDRVMLGMAWVFSLLFLAPHFLIEPRYYVIPAFFMNFFADFTDAQARRMTLWYAMLTAVGCVFVLGLIGHRVMIW